MKRVCVVLVALLLCAPFVFSGGKKEAPAVRPDAPGAVKVLVTTTSSEGYRNMVAELYARETGVQVEFELLPFTAFIEAVEVQLSAGASDFDVFNVDVPLVASYAGRGFLLPLDAHFSSNDTAKWAESARNAGTFEGELVAPPMRTSTQLLYFNKTLFDRAGVAPPPSDVNRRWTWEQTYNVASAVGRPDEGVWGILFGQWDRPYQLLPLPQSLGGGDGIGEGGLEVAGRLTNDAWIEAFEFLSRLYENNVAPRGVEQTQDAFLAGSAAMIVQGDWLLGLLRNVDFEWGVAPHPYFEDGTPVTPTGSWHWGVSAFSTRPNAAAEFVRALTVEDAYVVPLIQEGRLVPHEALLNLTFEDALAMNLPFTADALNIIQYELANTARSRPLSPAFLEWEDLLRTAIRDIVHGAPVRQTLSETERRMDSMFARYRR